MIEKNGFKTDGMSSQFDYTTDELRAVIIQCKKHSTSVGLVWWVNRRDLADYPMAIDAMSHLIIQVFQQGADVDAWMEYVKDQGVTRRPMPSENVDIQGAD